jgi:hypothetical protein
MIDYANDLPVLAVIALLFVLAFFAAIWPMDRY